MSTASTDRPLRVIQWTTGNIGRRSLHAIIGRPDMELVGVYAHGADKVGVDAADLGAAGVVDIEILGINGYADEVGTAGGEQRREAREGGDRVVRVRGEQSANGVEGVVEACVGERLEPSADGGERAAKFSLLGIGWIAV